MLPTLANISKTHELALVDKMDHFESRIAELPQVYLPLAHWFTDTQFAAIYLYTRQIFMPAGTIVTSRTHKIRHIFTISQGEFEVMNEKGYVERIIAPHTGVTFEGTRRVIRIIQDTIWTASYVTDTKDIEKVAEQVTFTANSNLPEEFVGAYKGKPSDILMPC